MRHETEHFTETVSTVAKAPGTPGTATLRGYCDKGLIPSIRDANGRRLLPANAADLARVIYAERLSRRGRPRKATGAA